MAGGCVFCVVGVDSSLELPLGSLALFELDRWDRVGLSSEGALSAVSIMCSWKLGRGELALFSRLADWTGCFVLEHWCSVSGRHVLEESG